MNNMQNQPQPAPQPQAAQPPVPPAQPAPPYPYIVPPPYPAPPPAPKQPDVMPPLPESFKPVRTKATIAFVFSLCAAIVAFFAPVLPFFDLYNDAALLYASFVSIAGLLFSTAGLILSVYARKRLPSTHRGLATAAMIISIVALAVNASIFYSCFCLYMTVAYW